MIVVSFQVSELQMSLSRMEQQTTWREEQFRQEIADVHKVRIL